MNIKLKSLVMAALALFCFTSRSAFAQRNAGAGCTDTAMSNQAAEIRNYYTSQGFLVVRDVTLKMDSRTPAPVIFNLTRGQLYQVIFVGNKASWKCEMNVFGPNDALIDNKYVLAHNEQPNYILYSMSPQQSDDYLFEFTQNMKKDRSMCGELLLLRMGSEKAVSSFRPYAP